MYKILTLIGTRPEIIKMSEVIKLLDKNFENILVHTGQNHDYELNEIFFKDLGLRKPDYFLKADSTSAINAISDIMIKTDKIIKKLKPDAFLIYGDTNSCLAAISAKKNKVPIFHFEAGNRSFDSLVPEETNRKIVDHISDINFVLTEHARRYLIREGINHHLIFKSGSHLPEIIKVHKTKINKSKIFNNLKLKKNNYFLFSFHREENVDNKDNLNEILESIELIYQNYKLPILISTHPRTLARFQKNKIYEKLKQNKKINFHKPLGFFDYLALQISSKCVISDSGTITEESSFLNFPAVTMRKSHERPEGFDSGVLIMTGLNKQSILSSIKITINNFNKSTNRQIPDFEQEDVSQKIMKIIISYIPYIKENTWKIKQ
jgi:UDP-N-acetylglucosamine 2-epimerase (non-hydrolysing)